ncbi:MAG: carbon monoxide dehydrogenase accessory protein [Actinomycetia bacterium]|nr:carbon monoxide dehydrogenase accessory protein [Actinomycetes bacterium]
MATRVSELIEQRRPFVQATVVRAQCPTSARPGDAAVVLPDGAIEGFVGGQCAEGSVRVAALDVLRDGESVLLRILPDDGEDFPESPGALTVVNPCLSGGALEVYLEPKLPAPVLVVVGQTPIAAALADFGPLLGFAVETAPDGSPGADGSARPNGALAVIVASHGRHEPESIRAALDAGVGFIGLVASMVRGRAVLDELALSDEERHRIHSPVGLAIGARTAEEIALAILADLVKAVRVDGLMAPGTGVERPLTTIDPVCGMTVTVAADTPHLAKDGVDYWFCTPGCRTRYIEELAS